MVTHLLPVKTMQEFLAYARANPGRIAYGSGGIGSAGHLSVELLQSLTGTKFTHGGKIIRELGVRADRSAPPPRSPASICP